MDIPSNWNRCSYLNKERWYYYNDGKIFHVDKDNNGEYVNQGIKKTKREFDSFFDTSIGETIWRSEQIRDKERAGQVFCSPEEAQKEARKNRAEIDNKARVESNARLREKILPILQRG